MDFEFEASSSFAYKFARYVIFPRIENLPEVQAGEPFRMVDLVKLFMNELLTSEQQAATFQKKESGRTTTVAAQVKFWASYVARYSNVFVDLGQGLFRAKIASDISEDELEEAALEGGDDEINEFDGWIYAFSFPSITRSSEPFPIKVGKTIHSVEDRIHAQCKGSATFENPLVLGRWQVKRVGPTELAVHNTLKARGKWREDVPGTEWFDTTIAEVESILNFVVETQN